jgi:hypothetical protein
VLLQHVARSARGDRFSQACVGVGVRQYHSQCLLIRPLQRRPSEFVRNVLELCARAYLATEVGDLSVRVESVAADCGFDGVHF